MYPTFEYLLTSSSSSIGCSFDYFMKNLSLLTSTHRRRKYQDDKRTEEKKQYICLTMVESNTGLPLLVPLQHLQDFSGHKMKPQVHQL